MDYILMTIKRNGAKNRMQMAHEFAKSKFFNQFETIGEIVATLKSYEANGDFIITDDMLTIRHWL